MNTFLALADFAALEASLADTAVTIVSAVTVVAAGALAFGCLLFGCSFFWRSFKGLDQPSRGDEEGEATVEKFHWEK